jgi:hypothetical protein
MANGAGMPFAAWAPASDTNNRLTISTENAAAVFMANSSCVRPSPFITAKGRAAHLSAALKPSM